MENDDYRERFGLVGWLLGAEALRRLRAAHVCVIGVGGVGSWAVEALARSGIGALTLVAVAVSNTNRQVCALDGAVGRPKVEMLAARVRAINPGCRVEAAEEFIGPGTAERRLSQDFDYVIDATDRMSNKALVIATCRARGLRVLTAGGAGGKRDPARIRTGDLGEAVNDSLLRLVRKKLRRDHGFAAGEGVPFGVRCVYSPERPVFPGSDGICRGEAEPGTDRGPEAGSPFGTAVFVTGAFGFAAAGEVVRALADGAPAPAAFRAPAAGRTSG